MRAGIVRHGRAQLAEKGAAALSVREIARGLGVASSAIYRHVANRDALLTLLVVDAYTELARHVEAGIDVGLRPEGPAGADDATRLGRLARAMREWAIAQPASWALLYGSPVPGYEAPAGETTSPGTRVMAMFVGALAGGSAARRDPDGPRVSPALASVLAAGVADLDAQHSFPQFARLAFEAPGFAADAIEAWTGLIGLISAEIFEQLGPDLARHGEELLERWVARTVVRFGLG